MCHVGAAAREADRARRLQYLMRAMECLDEAERLGSTGPAHRGRTRSKLRLDS